jgi:hypothetical protein
MGNGTHVGKKRGDCKHGHVAYGNKELEVHEFEVLVCKSEVLWERVKSWQDIKGNAVIAGYHGDKSPCYIVRAEYKSSVQIGKATNYNGAYVFFILNSFYL